MTTLAKEPTNKAKNAQDDGRFGAGGNPHHRSPWPLSRAAANLPYPLTIGTTGARP